MLLGPPDLACHGGGMGVISFGSQKNVKFGLLAAPERAESAA
jgi:hypothetical protein